ncbi:MAG: tRNA lysidine(34) synthetase TilS, partial [Candidatus Moranbacteria bacterium]|nr:tRNA lysidine(34) synthetase TilS [Candidatus Moranbacteria bacterium]
MKKNMVRIDERFHRNLSLFLEKEIPSDSSFVLAVSGGIDSMVLLDLFSGFVREKGVNACVAHMNHGIRAESDEEYEFVEAASKKNGLRFYGCKKDIPYLLKNSYRGRSPEECARDVRRSFLESVKDEFHGDYIVTAHHKDDLLETFIMRLIKGTGINGITGMRKTDGHILRPLMDFWRNDIENYAFLKKIEYREDKTNYDVDYLRNLIRIRTVPYLRESFGDSVKDVLIRDWDNLSAVDEFIDYYYLEDFKKKCEIKTDECHVFFCDVVKYPAAVRREYLLRLYRDWNGSVFG